MCLAQGCQSINHVDAITTIFPDVWLASSANDATFGIHREKPLEANDGTAGALRGQSGLGAGQGPELSWHGCHSICHGNQLGWWNEAPQRQMACR